MRRLIGMVIISLLCCGSVSTSHAFPKQLHIGKQQEYPPYIFEQDGKTVGICAELAEAAFAVLGISVTYTQYPFLRMLEYGKTGDVDAVMLVFKTPEREAYLSYPEQELFYEENSFFTKKDAQISYAGNLEDLKAYTIGVISGFSYGEMFDQATYLKKDFTLNDELLVKKLLVDRFKIGVGSKYVISYHAQKMGELENITFLEPNLFDKNPLYIGFSKARPGYEELTIKFSEALETLKRTGQYQRILQKYHVEISDEDMKK